MSEPFNASNHMIKVQGNRDYLPVNARVLSFREDHPMWCIETQLQYHDVEAGVAVFRAVIKDETDRTLATGTKMETHKGFPDYMEKAETGAIGRALNLMGYSTLNAIDEAGAPEGAKIQTDTPANIPTAEACEVCGTVLTAGQAKMAMDRHKRLICSACVKGAGK